MMNGWLNYMDLHGFAILKPRAGMPPAPRRAVWFVPGLTFATT
jgi:hypothetical protein